jgi:Rrf2 family protein
MKISKQEEYGLRCILQLAQQKKGEPLSVTEIAQREGLSVEYVTKLMTILRKTGLIKAIRGVHGGFVLSRSPSWISVGEVLTVLGSYSFDDSLCQKYHGNLESCVHISGCGIRPVWLSLVKHIMGVLDRISLADLLKDEEELKKEIETYYLLEVQGLHRISGSINL